MATMKAFTVSFNFDKDETKIRFTKDFLESDWITKADILKDSFYDIDDAYIKLMEEVYSKDKNT